MNGGACKISDQRAEYKRHAYDSYIKKVLRNELCVIIRENKKRRGNEVLFSDLPDIMIAEWGGFDDYPWEHSSFYVDGHTILVRNDRLAEALERLPKKECDILLMHYYLNMSDQEIAVRLKMPRRTVTNRRHITCRLLRKLMGGDQCGRL